MALAIASLPSSASQRAASSGAAAALSLSSLSQVLSTRDTKKLATDVRPSSEPPAATRSSRPARYASTTSSYCSSEKINVTLTLTPLAVSARIAGMPSGVAGTLIMTLGRPTSAASRSPSDTVLSVAVASSGSTSSEIRPSTPLLSWKSGSIRSQAPRMSSIASCS